jgi:hypothetical protein
MMGGSRSSAVWGRTKTPWCLAVRHGGEGDRGLARPAHARACTCAGSGRELGRAG